MKKIVLFALLLLVPTVSYAQPAIMFESETHDFGTLKGVEVLEHTFDFTNAGDQELIIKQVSAS